jgi:hypothetical protein
MSNELLPPNPPRLAREGGHAGELLRSADTEFREKLDESGAFKSIERLRRRRVAISWAVFGASGIVAALALTQGVNDFGRSPVDITATAEPLPAPPSPDIPQSVPAEEEKPAARVVSPPRAFAARPIEVEHRDEKSCQTLAAEGEAERAVDCFRTLARGQSIGAEVASYEAARITAETLRDAPRTLRLLDEHAARFPAGAMRGEVRWLRVQSLERASRFDEALSESEAMLGSPEGRALASEVHWLRARIYADVRNDCQRALSELVSLVGEPGARGDEAEMRRAACFERLGRTNEARLAYEKYLERAEPRP